MVVRVTYGDKDRDKDRDRGRDEGWYSGVEVAVVETGILN